METIGVTLEVLVPDFPAGIEWYTQLFRREPDFKPTEFLVEWEVAPNSWLQLSSGDVVAGRRVRFGVANIEQARQHLQDIGIRSTPPERLATVLRCDFRDAFGNDLGFFQDLE